MLTTYTSRTQSTAKMQFENLFKNIPKGSLDDHDHPHIYNHSSEAPENCLSDDKLFVIL